jgi:hypothetical protein
MNRLICFIAISCCALAQTPAELIQFDWQKLAAKASEKVDVHLEGPALELASRFLGNSGDEARVKQIIQGLRGIYVKAFEYDSPGQYSAADVAAIKSQLRAPEWTRIVDVQEKDESATVFLKTDGKQTQGLVVVAAEPTELAVVQILGTVDPAALAELGGKFGIPNMNFGPVPRTTKKKESGKKD